MLPGTAHADLQVCNYTSYVVEAAIGIEDRGTAATRGWFRIDAGQCRGVIQGRVEAEKLYVHARALPVYGASPMARSSHTELCVTDGNFVIAGARACPEQGQRLVPFTAVQPSDDAGSLVAHLAETNDYTAEQARLAGIQRLLALIGYDPGPVDGLEGRQTEGALAQFLADRKLPTEAAGAPAFFDVLIEAVKQAEGVGFAWCNETTLTVMAALGIEERGITTRGWYRVDPGKCLRPEFSGKPRRLYSFGEAVDGDGQAVRRGERALAWGGDTVLCTRNVKFEIFEQKDCPALGLTPTGFAAIELTGRSGATVRFREP